MELKMELLADEISQLIAQRLDICINPDQIADSKAIQILAEIQKVLRENSCLEKGNDFEIVEKIVCIFQQHHIDYGPCHDFG